MICIYNAIVVVATAALLALAFGTSGEGSAPPKYETVHQAAARYGVDLESRQCRRLVSLIEECRK